MPIELAITVSLGVIQIVIGILTLFQRGGIIFQARRMVQEGTFDRHAGDLQCLNSGSVDPVTMARIFETYRALYETNSDFRDI
jgi:hypothetical protein